MVELATIEMTDEDLKEKKLHLEYCKLNKIESDINLKNMEDQYENEIPRKLIQDDIDRVKDNIKKKVVYEASTGNEVDATDADIESMKLTLKKLESQKKQDLPMKKLRHEINKLREAKERIDAPEKQIKKLEKEIRTKTYQVPKKQTPSSVN